MGQGLGQRVVCGPRAPPVCPDTGLAVCGRRAAAAIAMGSSVCCHSWWLFGLPRGVRQESRLLTITLRGALLPPVPRRAVLSRPCLQWAGRGASTVHSAGPRCFVPPLPHPSHTKGLGPWYPQTCAHPGLSCQLGGNLQPEPCRVGHWYGAWWVLAPEAPDGTGGTACGSFGPPGVPCVRG